MKLLGWMHRKHRQNGDEPFKDCVVGKCFPCNCLTGQPAVDDQQSYNKPSYEARPYFLQTWKDTLNKISDVDSDGDEENYQDDAVAAAAELFHGFLTIGTLGSESMPTEPSTPTFPPYSVDYIAEKETEVTENELKLINDELEKVLVAEAKEEFGEDNSSGRTSYVSAGRTSHCSSTITLGGKPILETKEAECGRGGCDVCPLQEYLLSSAIESRNADAAQAKERRVSLGELFQRTKMTEADSQPKSEKVKRTIIMHIIRKIKNKMIQGGVAGGCGLSASATTDAATADTKLQKIIQMFHRKVHPDSPRSTRKELGRTPSPDDPGEKSRHSHRCKKRGTNARKSFRFPITNCLRNQAAEPPESDLEEGEDDSNGNRECWINTDADYLVLEL
ncbi:hypothetical protein MLD38_011855 [Melastoma candidum]|uniref:Uncharacterized protein n=1 Tax=Melastoma candidum TaxID=119954 RepID=A0ACB9R5Q9_9MYRT|nr:hypothetical protein MLD38_011855 [Melastoma candidum]